ncbi:MAG TPA: hypothetical protein VE863_00190 [Pyrinomonadaceae bacterium]|jgi:predicted Mrr-cat superfamily restriction endonuclease|nr:hypothetical protein [Pyrinomonadaceae bacterium]
MDITLKALFVVIIPILAFAAKRLVDYVFRNKTKELTAQLPEGKIENISVRVNASHGEVADTVRNELEFENHVFEVLQSMRDRIHGLETHTGRNVDFIASVGDHKLAIEVKNALDRVTSEEIQRYLSDESGLEKLLLISKQPPSKKVLARTQDLIKSGQVTFFNAPNAEELFPDLVKALDRELRL